MRKYPGTVLINATEASLFLSLFLSFFQFFFFLFGFIFIIIFSFLHHRSWSNTTQSDWILLFHCWPSTHFATLCPCKAPKCMLVSWYFEPSQPQRITSPLKTMFNLSQIYSARKSSNHKLSANHKISPDTNLHKTKHTQTSNTKFSMN